VYVVSLIWSCVCLSVCLLVTTSQKFWTDLTRFGKG